MLHTFWLHDRICFCVFASVFSLSSFAENLCLKSSLFSLHNQVSIQIHLIVVTQEVKLVVSVDLRETISHDMQKSA